MAKISFALIHNNNQERYLYVQSHISELMSDLSKLHDIHFYEIAYQNEIRPLNLLIVILRDLAILKLERDWRRYRILNQNSFLRQLLGLLKLIWLTKRYKKGGGWFRKSTIETIVTSKHIRAWDVCLETDSDYLIVFEDDVIFKKDSISRIRELLKSISELDKNNLVYVDLAGGVQRQDLMLRKLQSSQDNYYRYYCLPVTNTACCYFVNRKVIESFHEIICLKPGLRFLPIDWMINKLFIMMSNLGLNWFCAHADPSVFSHGTFSGEYVSWQKYEDKRG